MIASLSLIPLCQLAGEAFVRGLGLPMLVARAAGSVTRPIERANREATS
jgi:hypothetical protein